MLVSYVVFEDVYDRSDDSLKESVLICDCPDFTRADRVRRALSDTFYIKSPHSNFYVEYRIHIVESDSDCCF